MHSLPWFGHLFMIRGLRTVPVAAPMAGLLCAIALIVCGSAAAAAEEEDETKPRDIALQTKDGLELKATFYPSTLKKKERQDAVPIIILHAWKGNRGDCQELAMHLQKQGHAVITPDLRGHGESRSEDAKGKLDDAAKLRPADFRLMVTRDMEAIKEFLVQKNNDGELNIERLGVIGAEMGASVAMNWAAQDWSWPPLNGNKQGQDVKALVVISPILNFKGLTLTEALQSEALSREVSFLIIAGKGNKQFSGEADKLHSQLSKFHLNTDPEKKDLYIVEPDTKLQGTKLLNEPVLNLNKMITKFVELRLVDEKYPWALRKLPN